MIPNHLLYLMALTCALAVSTIYYHQPLLAQMAASFGVLPAHGSVIATLTQLGYAAGLLLLVPLGDRFQARHLTSLAIGTNALALLACAVAPTFPILLASSFAVGMTAITAQIIIPAVTGLVPPDMRGRVAGWLLGGLSSGLLLARTLSGFVGSHLSWRDVFVLAALLDLALLAIVLLSLPRSTGLVAIRYGDLMRSLATLAREQHLLRVSAVTGFLMFAAFSALWSSLALLLAAPPYEYGPAAIGAFGLVAVAGIASSPRIGATVDRLGASRMVFVGAILVALAFLLVSLSGRSLGWLIAGMVVLDLGNRVGLVANQARIYTLRSKARSRLNTVFIVSFFLGGAVGSAMGGYAAHHGGWLGLAAVGVTLGLAAVVANIFAFREEHSPGAREGA
ncbi:MFS transporter [Variovorax sp. Sphag1AA]|uniref:MFS transporter n=1 Tax=Variovorax sp. Sphag1AA TaxID=2587027 RepID=UPI0016184005|nr:MFS transporter [Variovorax sp. Sphag1AA]MBB3176373.1 putative MFS family arabinose efflux permease [Variovorax sp. Sphag1AA]